jgi:NhaC family Na+:H+ antiporter
MTKEPQAPGLGLSLIPVLFLIVLLTVNVLVFGDGALDGSNQIVLLVSAGLAAFLAMRMGFTWESLQDGIVNSIKSTLSALLILLFIGSLAGTWFLSGVVPAMIYYGLDLLNPTVFLVAACVVCAIVAIATGSSWTTVATVGVALLGIGKALGLSEAMIGGAIISGSYFGDKLSPLSDTTNLAPAMAGTDLFTHIRYMLYTTVPSMLITLVLFGILGFTSGGDGAVTDVEVVKMAILEKFDVHIGLFIVPVVVLVMIARKTPAIPALFVGTLLGAVFALIFQMPVVLEVAGMEEGSTTYQAFAGVMKAMYGSISVSTSNPIVNDLFSTGGMAGMMNTIWLIICAMTFGGVMETAGFLKRIAASIISMAHSTGSLVASTVGTCIFFNLTASDQYLAIVVPGRMYADVYRERGLDAKVLSRTLEDSGTVTSVLVPWNTCGMTQATVLGVATLTYLPFAFFNLISPLMTMLFAYANIKIARIPKAEAVKA